MSEFIPNLPPFFDMIFTRDDGKLSREGLLYNDQMFQSLNQLVVYINENLSPSGFNMPNATTAEITVYRDDNDVPIGAMWFNTDLLKLQVKTALGSPGTIETVTSTP